MHNLERARMEVFAAQHQVKGKKKKQRPTWKGAWGALGERKTKRRFSVKKRKRPNTE